MTDLDKLIEAVEAGRLSEAPHDLVKMPREMWEPIFKANSGSLDAALALHEALLPGWIVERMMQGDGFWTCQLGNEGRDWEEGESPTPARAWLLAILRAYRSEGQG